LGRITATRTPEENKVAICRFSSLIEVSRLLLSTVCARVANWLSTSSYRARCTTKNADTAINATAMPTTVAASRVTLVRNDTDFVSGVGSRMPGVCSSLTRGLRA